MSKRRCYKSERRGSNPNKYKFIHNFLYGNWLAIILLEYQFRVKNVASWNPLMSKQDYCSYLATCSSIYSSIVKLNHLEQSKWTSLLWYCKLNYSPSPIALALLASFTPLPWGWKLIIDTHYSSTFSEMTQKNTETTQQKYWYCQFMGWRVCECILRVIID